VLGIWLFASLCEQMSAKGVPSRPVAPLFVVFAAYGMVLLFAVSSAFGVWSAMHSVALVGLLFVGVPWLLVQGLTLYRRRTLSPYHLTAVVLSLGFPLVLAALAGLAFALDLP